MASSSKSASTSVSASAGDGNTCYPYDVFLNHRGADGKIFASNLYDLLTGNGLGVFLDTEEMEKGKRLTDQINGAIRAASVNIAIFSPKYCQSYWCLDELLLMLECMLEKEKERKNGSIILPIFLHVTPSEVRWAKKGKGRYAETLKSFEKKRTFYDLPRYDAEVIRKWKEALHEVAGISGYELDKKPYNGNETKLLDDVVDKVLKLVPEYLYVSDHPTGLEDELKKFEEKVLLQQHETGKVKVVGIVGFGGIGKTTLAKLIYNHKQKVYRHSSFVFDVRENDSGRRLKKLQRKLIKDLSKTKRDIDSTAKGISLLQNLLPHYHALIILDDVDCREQLDALLPVLPAKDSFILVTSRDKKVLEGWKFIENTFIYTLEGLSVPHSVELFCCHAFHQRDPVQGFEKLVNEFVKACDKVPLFLEVFGALVHGEKKPEHWKEYLDKMFKFPPEKIQKRLEISYQSLDDQEKMIFLDVARFFVGEEKDTAMRIWEASGWQASIGLQSLEKKHLVKVKEQPVRKVELHYYPKQVGKYYPECMVECITMHDQLRDMGRYLANKEPSRRRIWSVTKNLSEVQSPVGGIKNSAERDRLIADLRQRQPYGRSSCVESVFNVEQIPELILLRCYNCPDSSFPPNISTKNLRFLHIEGSNLETLWQLESDQAPRELRELYIAGSLTKIPESIGQLRLLEKVVLRSEGYDKLMSFETLPDEFCQLESLKHLELHQKCLKSLPDSFGELSSLQHVNLASCTCLEMLPGSFVNLTKLQHIDLSFCRKLPQLPDSFGRNLTNLQHLDLSGCTKLETLPNTFGNLIRLKFLSLQECVRLMRPSVHDVVDKVLKLAPYDLYVSKHPTGLEDKLEKFEEKVLLQQHETGKVKVVGIVGLGGIGKTTLAKQFYNLKQEDYPCSSFLSCVRENDSRRQLENLQRKLIKDLGLKDREIDSTDEGTPLLQKLLPHCHALIILDDVDSIEQLDALLPVLPAKDSLILVTSRDKKVLEDWKFIENTFIYTLEGLSPQHSVELFCWHAFDQRGPVQGFEKLVNEFVKACDKVPLLLEVFGALVHGEKKPEHWKEHLDKMFKFPPEKIQKRLEISYQSLDDQEKMIFLDVARFFVGEEKDTAMRIWGASGWQASIGLQSLEKKHLVEVKEQRVWKDGVEYFPRGFQKYYQMVECITMHDQLRDMGRYLADKEPSRRRIWSVTENLSEVQSHVGGIKNSAERNLQVADLRWRQKTSCVESVFNVEQPPQLILLRCYNCPDSSFPPNISTKNLRFLHIEGSNLETLWQLESQAPLELRELYIAGSLPKIPESIGQLRLLEKVVLRSEGDDKLMSFETLPDEFCQLKSLKHLELHQKCLKSLPDSFGDLSSLQHVNLAACTCLEMLPGSFVNLAKLLHIDLSHCQELQQLPDSFGNLTNLQHINLSSCEKLCLLPDSFGNLTNLKHINVSSCVKLCLLPDSFGNLTNLQHINLSSCVKFLSAPRFLWESEQSAAS